MIPVYLQAPNKPQHASKVGAAPEHGVTAGEVAEDVGVPADRLLGGKLTTREGEKCWLLVAV